jgi:hypothetical protein
VAVYAPNLKAAKDRRARGLVPNVFGTYSATETAALLGTHGLLHASFAYSRSDRTLGHPALAVLVERGLIRTYRARSQKGRPIVAATLNDAHPAAPEIAALAAALGRAFLVTQPTESTPRPVPPIVPLSTPADVTGTSADVLGPGLRQRVLLSVAAFGENRFMRVMTASQTIPKSLVEVIDILEASGMVRATRRHVRTELSLNERWECAHELRALLSRLLELNPEYADIAALIDGGFGKII